MQEWTAHRHLRMPALVHWPRTECSVQTMITQTPAAEQQKYSTNSTLCILSDNAVHRMPSFVKMVTDVEITTQPDNYFKDTVVPDCMLGECVMMPFYIGAINRGTRFTWSPGPGITSELAVRNLHIMQGCFHIGRFVKLMMQRCWKKSHLCKKSSWTYEQLKSVWQCFLNRDSELQNLSYFETTLSAIFNESQKHRDLFLRFDSLRLIVAEDALQEWACQTVARVIFIVSQCLMHGSLDAENWRELVGPMAQHTFSASDSEVSDYAALLNSCVFIDMCPDAMFSDQAHSAYDLSVSSLLAGLSEWQKQHISYKIRMYSDDAADWVKHNAFYRWWATQQPETMPQECRLRHCKHLDHFLKSEYVCVRQRVSNPQLSFVRLRNLHTVAEYENETLRTYVCEQVVDQTLAQLLHDRGLEIIRVFDLYKEANQCLSTTPWPCDEVITPEENPMLTFVKGVFVEQNQVMEPILAREWNQWADTSQDNVRDIIAPELALDAEQCMSYADATYADACFMPPGSQEFLEDLVCLDDRA